MCFRNKISTRQNQCHCLIFQFIILLIASLIYKVLSKMIFFEKHAHTIACLSYVYARFGHCILAQCSSVNIQQSRSHMLTHACNIVNCSVLWNKILCCGLHIHAPVTSRFLPMLPPSQVTNSTGISSPPSPCLLFLSFCRLFTRLPFCPHDSGIRIH